MTDYPKFLHLGRTILVHHSKDMYLCDGWPVSWPAIVKFAQEVLEHESKTYTREEFTIDGDDNGNGD